MTSHDDTGDARNREALRPLDAIAAVTILGCSMATAYPHDRNPPLNWMDGASIVTLWVTVWLLHAGVVASLGREERESTARIGLVSATAWIASLLILKAMNPYDPILMYRVVTLPIVTLASLVLVCGLTVLRAAHIVGTTCTVVACIAALASGIK